MIVEARQLSKRFGGVTAVRDLSAAVAEGEIVSIIGPNGAGKSTLLNLISGISRPSDGSVSLRGVDITGWATWRIARAGVARTFQNPRVFQRLSCVENVSVAGAPPSLTAEVVALVASGSRRMRRARDLLDRVGLAAFADSLASRLPYGHLRRLELARALALDPAVVLLDEPAAGSSPGEVEGLRKLLLEIRREGIALLLIEHNMQLVGDISDRVIVMNFGNKIAEGTPAEVRAHPGVIEAYLGSPRKGVRVG